MSLFKPILGLILHLANREIPFYRKDEFYKLKNRLLLKYAKPVQIEFQHIIKHCNRCEDGIFKCSWKLPETCWSCDGTTIYDEFWTKLMKYKLGKHYFHLPVEKYYDYIRFTKARKESTKQFAILQKPIEGYINHKTPKYGLGIEACLLLSLFDDPFTFYKKLGHCKRYHAITPLLLFNNLIFRLRHRQNIKYKISIFFRKLFLKKKQRYNELPF